MLEFAVSYLGIIAANAGVVVEKGIPMSRCDAEHCLRNKFYTKRPLKTNIRIPVSPNEISTLISFYVMLSKSLSC